MHQARFYFQPVSGEQARSRCHDHRTCPWSDGSIPCRYLMEDCHFLLRKQFLALPYDKTKEKVKIP